MLISLKFFVYSKCPAGFLGLRCETDVNECQSAPCRNGGICRDLINSYRCDCPIGYTGTNCEGKKLFFSSIKSCIYTYMSMHKKKNYQFARYK